MGGVIAAQPEAQRQRQRQQLAARCGVPSRGRPIRGDRIEGGQAVKLHATSNGILEWRNRRRSGPNATATNCGLQFCGQSRPALVVRSDKFNGANATVTV
jgi:hypothetical protein